MPEMPDAPYFELAPDWISEVPSPSTAATDRADKMCIYAEAGVRHTWLVDPLQGTLEAFRHDGAAWRVLGTWRGDARVRVEPFEAMELELAALWAR